MGISDKTGIIIDFFNRYSVFNIKSIEKVLGLPERTIRLNGSRNITDENCNKIIGYLRSIVFEYKEGVISDRGHVHVVRDIKDGIITTYSGREFNVDDIALAVSDGGESKNFVELSISTGVYMVTEGGLKRRKYVKDVVGMGMAVDSEDYKWEPKQGYEDPIFLIRDTVRVTSDKKIGGPYILFYRSKIV